MQNGAGKGGKKMNVVSFVNDRNELFVREEKAKAYSEMCKAKRKVNRLKSVGFFLLASFEISAMLYVVAYYVFIG